MISRRIYKTTFKIRIKTKFGDGPLGVTHSSSFN